MANPDVLAPPPNYTIDAVADRMAELKSADLDFDDNVDDGRALETSADQEAARASENEDEGEEQEGEQPPAEEDAPEGDEPGQEAEAEEVGDGTDLLEITLTDGKKVEVSTDELAKLYENASSIDEDRGKIVEAWQGFEKSRGEEIKRISAMGEEISERLQYLQQINVVGEAPSPAMLDPSSQQYDPDNYHLQRANYEQRREIDKRIKADLGAVQTLQTQERDRAVKGLIAAETLKTQEAWPEIVSSGEVGDKARADLISGASQYYSISKSELAEIADSRQLSVLRDALAYRRMTEKAPEVQKKLASKPRLVKPGAKETNKSRTGRKTTEARDRLRKSGSVGDAMAVFEKLNL